METIENKPSPPPARLPKPQRRAPVPYSEETADAICELVATGYAMSHIEQMEGMPSAISIYDWQKRYPSFDLAFTRAREARADLRFDRIDDYGEKLMHGEIQPDVARILIEKEKWQAAQDNNARYGTKQRIEQVNTHLHAHVVSDMSTASLLAELQRTAQALPGGVKLADDKLVIDATYTSDDTSKG